MNSVDIIRPNSTEGLIESENNVGSYLEEGCEYLAACGYTTRGWTVNVSNLSTSVAPAASLVVMPAATVNLSGHVSFDTSTNTVDSDETIIRAMVVNVSGADTDVLLRNHKASSTSNRATIQSSVYGSTTVPVENSLNVTGGAQLLLENLSEGDSPEALYMAFGETPDIAANALHPGGDTSSYFRASGAGTNVEMLSHGHGSGATAATAVLVGHPPVADCGVDVNVDIDSNGDGVTDNDVNCGGGGFNITGGAVVNVRALATSEGEGMPALVQEIDGGNFNVSGEGSELNVQSDGVNDEYGDYGAALRIRKVGNQTMNVTDLGVLKVIRSRRDGGQTPAAIRFGDGENNTLNVASGGVIWVENDGTGEVSTDGSERDNNAIEFSANDFTFNISGSKAWTSDGDGHEKNQIQPSAVQLIAVDGAAVAAYNEENNVGYTGGSISVKDGGVFVAHGAVDSDTEGIFRTGNYFTFTADNPLYYDFANYRNNGDGDQLGGVVFSIDGGDATFDLVTSDMSVWRSGKSGVPEAGNDVVQDTTDGEDNLESYPNGAEVGNWPNPFRNWTNINLELSGSTFDHHDGSSGGSPKFDINDIILYI